MKLITFSQFYNIVCENTDQKILDAVSKFLQQYPGIIEQTKKYITHCMYELQRETVPLYYSVIKQLKIIPTLELPTLAVDMCGNLWYNPLFVRDELIKDNNDAKLKGVLVHEAMHIIDRTQARVIAAHRSAYDKATQPAATSDDKRVYDLIHTLSNYAYDLIINRDVKKEGFDLPDGIIADVNENGKCTYSFDFTTKDDSAPDIKTIDVTRYTGEKAYNMFVGALHYASDKLLKQGRITQEQYNKLDEILQRLR